LLSPQVPRLTQPVRSPAKRAATGAGKCKGTLYPAKDTPPDVASTAPGAAAGAERP
jgi:hypothetical protein